MDKKYLKLDECIDGGLYIVDARNFSGAVFSKNHNGFYGIRYKFGDRFIDFEFHYDHDKIHGTAKPLLFLEMYEPEPKDNNQLFKYLTDKKLIYQFDDYLNILLEIEKINKMDRIEMARLWRFAPSGHPYFDGTKPYYKVFKKRFDELGGFSPAISKHIGW